MLAAFSEKLRFQLILQNTRCFALMHGHAQRERVCSVHNHNVSCTQHSSMRTSGSDK